MTEPESTPATGRLYSSEPQASTSERATGWLGHLVLGHFGILTVFTSWAFGGQAPWARDLLLVWGTLGIILFFVATGFSGPRQGLAPWPCLRLLWPLLLFDVLVGLSCLNPGFREILRAGTPYYVLQTPPHAWLPSSARPGLSLRELWLFNAVVLSCCNLYLALPNRRSIRTALFIMAVNAVVLAVFGTFQKLVGAPGLWFGLVHSPNEHFFATFIYHNHWGAFTLLNLAVCLGLFFHHARRGGYRDIWHSPVLAGATATLLLAVSVPLSASRSSSVLALLFLLAALVHILVRLIRRRRALNESASVPVTAIVLTTLLAALAIAWLGRSVIGQRARLTAEQFARIHSEETLNSRLTLYRDTWRMAMEKPWFGWGLESYAVVFRIFNSQRTAERWVPYYAEAHSDWLQSCAEVGLTGTALLVLLGLQPLLSIRWRRVGSVLPRYLLAGCGLLLLYAWVEFPFANPSVMIAFWACLFCAVRYAELNLRAQETSG